MANRFDKHRDANGLYPDNISEIVAESDAELSDLIGRVRAIVVGHERFDNAVAWLRKMLAMSGTGREAAAGLLVGPSGVGKTTLIEWFVEEHGGVFNTVSGKVVRPIVVTSVPSETTMRGLYDEILFALDAPDLSMGNAADRKLAVLTQLRLQEVKILVIDEFNHVIEDKTDKFTNRFLRAIKHLITANVCQVVLAGTEDVPAIYARDRQMKRRIAGDMFLTVHDWESERDRAEWIAMMAGIEEQLPMRPGFRLGSERNAGRLHRSCDGLLDGLIKFLVDATSVAYEEGYDVLLEVHLWQAFENLRRGDWKATNPWNGGDRRPRKPSISKRKDDESSGLSSRGGKLKDPFG